MRSEIFLMIMCQVKKKRRRKKRLESLFFLVHQGRKDPGEEMIDVLTTENESLNRENVRLSYQWESFKD